MKKLYLIALMTAFTATLTACGKKTSTPTPPAPVAPAPPAPVNTAPTAVISAQSTTVEEGDTVELDGASSSDPENDSLSYYWVQTAGRDLRISDRTTAQQNLRVPDLEMDETVEFELTVSDGSFESSATQTITLRNVDQSPKLNAPTFSEPSNELRFDGPITLISTTLYNEVFSIFPRFTDFIPVISDTPSGEELRSIFVPGSDGNIGTSPASTPILSEGPRISEQPIDRYSITSGSVRDVVTNATFPRIGVTLDVGTNDIIVFAYINQNTPAPRDLARANVADVCQYIGEVEFNGVPHPTERRRYFALSLNGGGLSLWSTDINFNASGARLQFPVTLTPDLRHEGDFFSERSFCGPTLVSPLNGVDQLTVLDTQSRSLRRYELQSGGSLNSVRLSEFTDQAIQFDFGDIPNLSFVDGFIRPQREFSVSIWSDGERDGEHRVVVTDRTGQVIIKSWDKGVPERVRLSTIGFTPLSELPDFRFPPRPGSRYLEPLDIVIFTPDTPNLVVFRMGNYGFEIRENTFSGFQRTVLLFNDELPISDAQYVDVGLDATDIEIVRADVGFEKHILLLRRNQNKIDRFRRISIE